MASNPNRPPVAEGLSVVPLNSVPFIDPFESMSDMPIPSGDYQGETRPDAPKPALIFLPSRPTEEERNNVLSVTNNGICLGGSAAGGAFGPLLGKRDIGESADSYIFRVSLPGVAREDFTCHLDSDGQVFIKGVTTTGEKTVKKDLMEFEMLTQNLCPPGDFTISFKLPGPVEELSLDANLEDGVLEGLVNKKTVAN